MPFVHKSPQIRKTALPRCGGRSFFVSALFLMAGCHAWQSDQPDGCAGLFCHCPKPVDEARLANSEESGQLATPPGARPNAQAADASNAAEIADNLNRGHREAAMNRPQEAEKFYHRVLALDPNNSIANHRLAVLADKRREYATAEYYYLAALRRDPDNPDLLSDFGYSCYLQGRLQESERSLLAATRIAPSHEKALHNLGLLYAKMGDYDRSYDALKLALGESRAQTEISQLFPQHPVSPASRHEQSTRQGDSDIPDDEPIVASFEPVPSNDITPRAPIAESPPETMAFGWEGPSTTKTSDQVPHSSSAAKRAVEDNFVDAPSEAQTKVATVNINPLDSMPLWPTEKPAAESAEKVAQNPEKFPPEEQDVTVKPDSSAWENETSVASKPTAAPTVAPEHTETDLPTANEKVHSDIAAQSSQPLGMGPSPEPLFGSTPDLPADGPNVDAFAELAKPQPTGNSKKPPRIAATSVIVPSTIFEEPPLTFVVPELSPEEIFKQRRRKRALTRKVATISQTPAVKYPAANDSFSKNSVVSQISADKQFIAIPYDPPQLPVRVQPRANLQEQSAEAPGASGDLTISNQAAPSDIRQSTEDEASAQDDGPIIRPGPSR